MGQQTPGEGPHGGVRVPQSQKGVPLTEALQWEPAGQAWPHAPQLLSVVSATQDPPQQSWWTVTWQMPEPQQTSSEAPRQAPLLQGGKAVPLQAHVP
jgi:hypothetical protein